MQSHSLRRWYKLHRWTSLVCTVFLLISCITGLPLIFGDELEQIGKPQTEEAIEIPAIPLQHFVDLALIRHPGAHPAFMTIEEDAPEIRVAVVGKAIKGRVIDVYHASTAAPLSSGTQGNSVMEKVLALHRGLFAGVPGELFMGAMALLFVLALISGIVVYGPFMRRLPFGTVRPTPHRTHWLDLHNLLGASALCWMLVVGGTGILNAISAPLFALWQKQSAISVLASYKGHPPATNIVTPDVAAAAARRALPGMKVTGIVFPGPTTTPWHYLIYTKGRTPITSRIFTPVLVDATTGIVTSSTQFPWYIHTVEVSRPLHFGDYGGLPLKFLWAALDLVAITVLISGIMLWVGKGRATEFVADKTPRRHAHQRPRSSLQIYRWPIVLAITSLCGLLSALIGDGWWDALSWCLLLLCVLACTPGLIHKLTPDSLL
ncbi:PepSY-associated TM helix domain-containing protein [Terriglobus roseus]|uniref:Uncharacterized iron-regulated membrane protein n=1 Tax=Terriglobus roseus TaxID=392734 RepID=A0A1G7G1P5_9BACT|nr:PepSY-associated TM helix domain-containing protein [Terriglobus roseus]SDE82023.1 Uncharacterized iron-regulated membrane protein [Terriglobus roseus]